MKPQITVQFEEWDDQGFTAYACGCDQYGNPAEYRASTGKWAIERENGQTTYHGLHDVSANIEAPDYSR